MTVESDTWFIAKKVDNSVVHYGYSPNGTNIDTGQPVLTQYASEALWIEALGLLEINPNPTEPAEPLII